MDYIVNKNLAYFNFWGGAEQNAKMLTFDEMETLDNLLNDLWIERQPTETEINDLFRFDFDYICELLNYKYDIENGEIIRLRK